MPDRTCSIDGCDRPHLARGWCSAHYRRWSKHGDPLGGHTVRGTPAQFIDEAVASSTDDCIPWPFAMSSQGYGRAWYGGRVDYAHRLVLELVKGPSPTPKHHAAHAPLICHNRACVNPRHLRWATATGNSHDMQLDGTQFHSRGELSGVAKLTAAQVLAIRADQRSNRAVAEDYGISRHYVPKLKARTRWAHL